MKKLRRDELVDYQTWTERRTAEQPAILVAKAARRIHLGAHLTLLFENSETIRWQVQEMMRVERIVREADIVHELTTYNELVGDPGELGCTLLVEIDDAALRAVKLREWLGLEERVGAVLDGGERVAAVFDRRQIGDRLSSVQYLRFPVGGKVPLGFVCEQPGCEAEVTLSEETRAALAEDLRS